MREKIVIYQDTSKCKYNLESKVMSRMAVRIMPRLTRPSTRLRCVRTGLKLVSADTGTNANLHMVTGNL